MVVILKHLYNFHSMGTSLWDCSHSVLHVCGMLRCLISVTLLLLHIKIVSRLYCPWARYLNHIEIFHESGNTVAAAVLMDTVKRTLFALCECLLKECRHVTHFRQSYGAAERSCCRNIGGTDLLCE